MMFKELRCGGEGEAPSHHDVSAKKRRALRK
jgi:hypothetical protein